MDGKIQRSISCASLLAFAFALTGCGRRDAAEGGGTHPGSGSGKPRVFAVNYPLAFFAERIGGDAVEVILPVPEDSDPAFWEPGEDDIAAFQSADLILRNGATYAKWMEKVSLPESIQVDTSAAFAERFIDTHSATTHSHGSAGKHSHAGVAFTTWIDPRQAARQAEAIRAALAELLPRQASTFDSNFTRLKAELEALDTDLAAAAKQIGDQPLVASHPVYQYLARRYGLKIQSVLWEPEVIPDAAALAALRALLEKHPARVMIWEGEPAAESVAKLEGLGVKSVVFAPCGNRPDSGEDFFTVMRANIDQLSGVPKTPAPRQ